MNCVKCSKSEGKVHYHIVVENGVVMSVWYVSADGLWDRELEGSDYFVEYKDVWLTPKVYHGETKSMCELGECDCPTNPDCVCCK